MLAIIIALCLTGVNAYAKKPEVTRHDAQYLDRQVSINVQWQSSEAVVSVRVAAGKGVKEVKIDPYDNKKTRSGYTGEANIVLQADPLMDQESIPYTIQIQDEDGQKSNLITGKAAIPASALATQRDDRWGKERLTGPQGGQKDMIDQLRKVAAVLAAPPFLQDVIVNNPGSGTVTFKTKATHTVGLKEINFRIFDGGNKQVDSQQISATGTLWEGTSKDFTLPEGNYFVIAQAIDGGGSTSQERRAHFTIGGTKPPIVGPIVVEVPALTVNITPQDVLAQGAQWRLGTGEWKSSGDKISSGLTVGWSDVEFKDVPGWKKPDTMKVSLEAGKLSTITGAYNTFLSRAYTVNKDFEEGKLVGLEDQTVPDQLQLSKTSTTLPFIWIPNSNEGTISKVDTKTGAELGRYWTGPGGGNPSRTTVDLMGNCWVGNRNTGTVVKVGLSENGQCVDRNGNGKIETSTGKDALPWGQDECVLYEVALFKGKEATYKPGEYKGGYDGGPGPRGLAIDANNNLWAGTYGTNRYYYIDGSTGKILRTIDVSSSSHNAYGAVVDKNGILWSADISHNHVLRLDPASGTFKAVNLSHNAYGMCIDKNNHLFVAGWCYNKLSRINTQTAQVEWTKDTGDSCSRGVAVTNDGDVWVANSGSNNVSRWSNDGQKKTIIPGFNHPTGAATDAEGYVWVVNYNDNYIKRIDPATNKVNLEKAIGSGHYGYSDMTGIVARSMTTKLGTWTVTFDSKADGTNWGNISWNSTEPQGTSVKVKARSSVDSQIWSAWEDVAKGVDLKTTPAGKYIQIETTLQIVSGEASPLLADLTVQAK